MRVCFDEKTSKQAETYKRAGAMWRALARRRVEVNGQQLSAGRRRRMNETDDDRRWFAHARHDAARTPAAVGSGPPARRRPQSLRFHHRLQSPPRWLPPRPRPIATTTPRRATGGLPARYQRQRNTHTHTHTHTHTQNNSRIRIESANIKKNNPPSDYRFVVDCCTAASRGNVVLWF